MHMKPSPTQCPWFYMILSPPRGHGFTLHFIAVWVWTPRGVQSLRQWWTREAPSMMCEASMATPCWIRKLPVLRDWPIVFVQTTDSWPQRVNTWWRHTMIGWVHRMIVCSHLAAVWSHHLVSHSLQTWLSHQPTSVPRSPIMRGKRSWLAKVMPALKECTTTSV